MNRYASLALLILAVCGVFAFASSARTTQFDCCYPGSPCCFSGSPCCEGVVDCCGPNSACCFPDSPCCQDKTCCSPEKSCCNPPQECCFTGTCCDQVKAAAQGCCVSKAAKLASPVSAKKKSGCCAGN